MKRYVIYFSTPSINEANYYLWAENMISALLAFGDLVVGADVRSCERVAP